MPKLHTLVLTKDQDVLPAIHSYLMDKKWKGGVIVGGVGSIYNVTCGTPENYDAPPPVCSTTIERPCEIVSFMGEITKKEDAPPNLPKLVSETPSDYIVHIHFAVAHDGGTVTGGGFQRATVLRAVNVYILEME